MTASIMLELLGARAPYPCRLATDAATYVCILHRGHELRCSSINSRYLVVMSIEEELIAMEHAFDTALVAADWHTIGRILADDLLMIDLSGRAITKADLLGAMQSKELAFRNIEPSDISVRVFDNTAVVTGRTAMKADYQGAAFEANTRYTHVYVNRAAGWAMVHAQGTIVSGS